MLQFTLASLSSTDAINSPFVVPSVSWFALEKGDALALATMRNALTEDGMLSMTGIPGYAALRKEVLAESAACGVKSETAQAHTFSDGTTRRSLASRTVPGEGGVQAVAKDCGAFDLTAKPFRQAVGAATDLFASQLASLLDADTPLLTTKRGHAFDTFADVTENGEHLEHFHSYTKPTGAAPTPTLEMHTDQGIFIAFTPALMLKDGKPNAAATTTDDAGAFFIKRADGSRARVHFDDDSLVFMLGDGIHQVTEHKLRPGSPRLRSTPHSLFAPVTTPNSARVWYGRMVLPPHDALSPEHDTKTFGNIRDSMIAAVREGKQDEEEVMALGCSGGLRADQRELAECLVGEIWCWNRCMNTTANQGVYYGVSQDICAAQGKNLQCTDVLDRIYDPDFDSHGDYFPACSASTQLVDSDFPTLPNYPRDAATCDPTAWEIYASTTGYDFSYDLGGLGRLMWNVNGEYITAKMVYNGLFGFLAWGFRNPTGSKMGMQGAPIVMAQPGGDYTLTGGLNLSAPGTVKEYIIHHQQSRFRFWQGSGQVASAFGSSTIPTVTQHLTDASYDVGDCFSSMTFTSDQIAGQKFNVGGTDQLIWAANVENKYVEHHGRGNRGLVEITWMAGGAPFADYPPPPAPSPPLPSPPTVSRSSLSDGELAGIIVGAVVGGLLLVGIVAFALMKKSDSSAKGKAGKAIDIPTSSTVAYTTSSASSAAEEKA
mmetsp:Transcript_83320/g.166326  ORF Transcript_83320/g.166326 Transcript_83320/m.166326 type:complete len:714 (-) Transcript_83320:84-2225(-)